MLGQAGLLSLPYPEEYGGGGQPYEVYLQVLEEIAAVWSCVGVGVSVHALSCFGLAYYGTDEQRAEWLPDMLGGDLLGAYCLSEAHAGSDPAAMRTTARRDGDDYVLNGAKAWTTHGGHADFYKVMARTSDDRNGISCFLVPADAEGLSADPPERKMGLTGSATATMRFDDVRVAAVAPARRRGRRAADRARRARLRPPRHRRRRRRASPRARSTTRSPTPASARPSASRSSTTRAWPSCSPTWRPPSSRARATMLHAARLQGRRAAVLAARRRSPSWSPPTTP